MYGCRNPDFKNRSYIKMVLSHILLRLGSQDNIYGLIFQNYGIRVYMYVCPGVVGFIVAQFFASENATIPKGACSTLCCNGLWLEVLTGCILEYNVAKDILCDIVQILAMA